jgi:integrase
LYRDDGTPIKNRKEAREKADTLLLPLMAGSEVDRLRAMLAALESAEQKAARAEAALQEAREKDEERKRRGRTKLEGCWRLYCKAIRESGKMTGAEDIPAHGTNRYNYRTYFQIFTAWARRRFFGRDSVLLADISGDDAKDFFAELAREGKSQGTYNKYLHFLRSFTETVFEACGLKGLENPFGAVATMTQHKPKRRRVLSVEQATEILDKAEGELKTLCFLGYYTGLRLGDCCTLEWKEVDLERRIITRTPRKTAKTSGAEVKIGIPLPLLAHLRALPNRDGAGGFIVPDMARRYNLNRNNVCRPIKALFEACGLRNDKGFTEYGFHCFRHTYITMHAEAGTPLAVLQSIAGHSNSVMTEHYIGAVSDDAAVRFADNAYGKSNGQNE